MPHSLKQRGFTLLEISIVLVIIALLVGTVTVGRSIIKNAELQSVVSDVERYKKAAQLFRDKYKEWPGDFSTATDYWGANAGCPNPANSDTAATTTCNGDGNSFVGVAVSSAPSYLGGYAIAVFEPLFFWQHLANAELIDGRYSGRGALTGTFHKAGVNLPKSKLGSNVFTFFYSSSNGPPDDTGAFLANYRHIFVLGTIYANVLDSPAIGPGLFVSEALSIDQKMDDGMPDSGKVLSYTPNLALTPNCATSDDPLVAEYNVAYTDLACSLIFISGF